MDCPKCGYSAGPGEKYCPMCEALLPAPAREGEPEADSSEFWRRHGGLLMTAGVVAIGLVVLLILLVGGSSGSSGVGGQAAAGATSTLAAGQAGQQAQGVAVYTDPVFGYGFEYPASWQVIQDAADLGAAGAVAASRVSVVDPSGVLVGGDCIDLVNVAVFQLSAAVDESAMADVRPQVEQVVASLTSQGDDAQVTEYLSEISAAGMPGFRATISSAIEGIPLTGTMYFLFSGDIEYQLTLQAATENWEAKSPTLEAILASFRPGAAN